MTSRSTAARASTERLLAQPAPLHVDLSSDGRSVTLTTVEVPTGSETEVVRLVEIELASGAVVRRFDEGDRLGVWSPDGGSVAVCTNGAGDTTTIAVWEGSNRTVLQVAVDVMGPVTWSPDGAALAFPARTGTAIDRTRPFRWTRPILAFDGLGELDDPPRIALHTLATGVTRFLVDDGWRWSMPRWSPDGTMISAVALLDPTGSSSGQRLWVIDVESGRAEQAPIPAGRTVVSNWLPDGRLLALVSEPKDRPLGGVARLFVVDAGVTRELGVSDLFGDVYGDNPAEAADNPATILQVDGHGRVVVRTGRRGRMGVVALDPDDPTDVAAVTSGDRCVSPLAVAGSTLVATSQSAEAGVDLVVIELASRVERRLTNFSEPLNVRVDRFAVASHGVSIDAWIVRPRSAPDVPLPTVVLVHGGPHFAFGESFSFDVQALCAAGFAVLYPNVRGSTGYGDDFAHSVHGDWAEGPSDDLLAVLDHAVERGWVDGDRVGIAGNSYGGYLSAWLISTTRRFRAAVIENPVTDLIGMYATSDIGDHYFPAQMGGAPHERPEVYLGQSPLLRAHECRTPSLFVIGELDRRCPGGQALGMHRVLCSVGTPSEVLVLPGSSHEGSTYGPPVVRLAHDEALVDWMDRWLT
jgi:dipeptidyl aminopeptidase/acylaminoacyl peptidase